MAPKSLFYIVAPEVGQWDRWDLALGSVGLEPFLPQECFPWWLRSLLSYPAALRVNHTIHSLLW